MPQIDHAITFLRTARPEENKTFYGQTLGLSLVLDQGACRIYRVTTGASIGFCADDKPLPEPTSTVVFTLVTQDVDGWYEKLSEAGVPTDGPPRHNEKYQIDHFYADDPDGYRIEVQRFTDPRWEP